VLVIVTVSVTKMYRRSTGLGLVRATARQADRVMVEMRKRIAIRRVRRQCRR
jgi:hypothetical protein